MYYVLRITTVLLGSCSRLYLCCLLIAKLKSLYLLLCYGYVNLPSVYVMHLCSSFSRNR
jgi:hypothetical protein